jgi:senataxin
MDIEDFLVPSDAPGAVLVLNSFRGLENCGKFERVFLENRSHELYCCVKLCKSLLRSMSFLDLSGFYHSPRCPSSDECERCSNQLVPFSVKLFAERFTDIMIHLCDHLVYLVSSGSAISLLDEDRDSILELLQPMKQFHALLHNKDLRQDKVEAEFKLILVTDAVDSADCEAKLLNETRMSCIRLIAKLSNSLQLAQPENRDDIGKICIQHSKIIITSLDCTWKLHGQGIDAFDVLIVNGANQIKTLDMLLPLALPIRHIIFFGDPLHVQAFVHSKVCTLLA